MSIPRAYLIYAISLVAAFGISFGIGYLYQYDPERDLVEVVVDNSAAVIPGSGLLSGTIRSLNDSVAAVETEFGTIELLLTGVTLEQLLPLDYPTTIVAGTPVNLGGERTETERVITGLVFLEGQSQP